MEIRYKKGDPLDVVLFVIMMFIFAISFLVYLYFTTQTSAALSQSTLNNSATAPGIQALADLGTRGASEGFLFFMGAMILGMMVTSFFVREHPIFVIIYVLMLIGTLFLAGFLGNAYVALTANPPLDVLAAASPVIDVIMRHIMTIACVFGVISMIISLAKIFSPSGNQI